MGPSCVERGLQSLVEDPSVHLPDPGHQQDVDQILHPTAFTGEMGARIGMGFFGNLLGQWITGDLGGRNVGKGQECWRGQVLRWLNQQVTPSDVDMKVLKAPTVDQAPDEASSSDRGSLR